MERIEHLNKHLSTLVSMNDDGSYDDDIRVVVNAINNELGVRGDKTLSSYSTVELHNELVKRTGINEIIVDNNQEVVITTISGDVDRNKSFVGPVRVLVNRD